MAAKVRSILIFSALLLSTVCVGAETHIATADAVESTMLPSDTVDQTDHLAEILAKGSKDIHFPSGIYVLGSVSIPEDTKITFASGAIWKVSSARVQDKALLKVLGNNVELSGIKFDFSGTDGREIGKDTLRSVILAENVNALKISGLVLTSQLPWRENGRQSGFYGINLKNCRDVDISMCSAKNLVSLVHCIFTSNLVVRNNRMEHGRNITSFRDGGEYLKHYGNWSNDVIDQVYWWGGDANELKPGVTKGSSAEVKRGTRPGSEDYDNNRVGTFDIIVSNNYAENGRTLAWGSKGRNIVISENIARFMGDMAYDTEGGENVIISNNISINSAAAGIGCYFWSEKVVISGNIVTVQNEGDSGLRGEFIRLHSLNPSANLKTGSGQIVISGNLFSSDLDDRRRNITIESGRDVMITGNKFVNGGIKAKQLSLGPLTISNNDFIQNFPFEGAVISILDGASEANVSENRLRFEGNGPLNPPAILISSRERRLRIVDRNTISGWAVAILAEVSRRNGAISAGKFLVRDNIVEGKIQYSFSDDEATAKFIGNLSGENFLEVDPEYLPH